VDTVRVMAIVGAWLCDGMLVWLQPCDWRGTGVPVRLVLDSGRGLARGLDYLRTYVQCGQVLHVYLR
jgi:hypothetical protein